MGNVSPANCILKHFPGLQECCYRGAAGRPEWAGGAAPGRGQAGSGELECPALAGQGHTALGWELIRETSMASSCRMRSGARGWVGARVRGSKKEGKTHVWLLPSPGQTLGVLLTVTFFVEVSKQPGETRLSQSSYDSCQSHCAVGTPEKLRNQANRPG